jgi:hypothetical protein
VDRLWPCGPTVAVAVCEANAWFVYNDAFRGLSSKTNGVIEGHDCLTCKG